MTAIDIDRFNKLIDEKHIYQASKKALKEIVEEFFSRDYQGVSKEGMEEYKRDFEGRFLMTVISRVMKTERNEIDNLHDQIKTSLDVILDKSVDKARSEDMAKKVIVYQYGSQNRFYSDSDDKSVNIIGDLTVDLESLKALIQRDYQKDDKQELLQIVNQMKQSCKDPSKKNWLREKFGWLLTRTSEVASISSFAMAILKNI